MKRILFFFLVMLSVGCSNSYQKQVITENLSNKNDFAYHLYGKLEKVNESYSFTSFSESYKKSEPWVQLSDMTPMWDISKETCVTGVVEFSNKAITCKTANERLFRNKSTDFTPSKTTSYAIMSVLSFGLWALMPPGAVAFDQQAFELAIIEAKTKLNSQSNYLNILKDYDSNLKSYATNTDKIILNYPFNTTTNIKVVDRSGLLDKEKYDFRDHIILNNNKLNEKFKPLTTKNLKVLFEKRKSSLEPLIENISKLASEINVTCKKNLHSELNYIVSCPSKVRSKDPNLNITITVNSINYNNIKPDSIVSEDETIIVNLKDGAFFIENKTESYIHVDTVSFYHNGKIASSTKLDRQLPPLSEDKLTDIYSMSLNEKAISFDNITKQKAKRTNVKYGIATKYTVVDTDKEKTLLHLKPYLLFNLI